MRISRVESRLNFSFAPLFAQFIELFDIDLVFE